MAGLTRTALAAALAAGAIGVGGCSNGNYTCCRRGVAPAAVQATLGTPRRPGTVRLRPEQTLELRAAGTQEVSADPPGVLRQLNPGPGVLEFRAERRGRATITVERTTCGAEAVHCSHLSTRVVVVTVR